MARSVLDIVIKLSKQGGADRETVKGLVQVKSAFAQVASVAAVATGALYTAKKAFDFTKEGAQLQFVEDRFNRLGASIGANTGLLGDLRSVTRGLYSDTELMTSAADLMGLGLAKNSQELERLLKVSSGLNMNMNQLVLTLTNMTDMRFDALGVSVDGFKEKVQDLEDAGMDANAAFKEAFLQQAEGQLEKVGEAADSTAGAFMRLEASSSNFWDSIKKDSAEGGAAFADWAATSIDKAMEYRDAMEKASEAGFNDPRSQRYAAVMIMQTEQMTASLNTYQNALGQYYSQLNEGIILTQEQAKATENWSLGLDAVQTSISGPIVSAQEDYQARLSDLKTKLAELQAQESKWGAPPEGSKKYDELQGKIADVRQEIDNTTAAYEEQARQIMFNIAQEQLLASSLSAEQQAEAIAVLGQSMGMWDQKTADAISTTAAWTDQLTDGQLTTQQYAQLVGLLGDSMFGMGKQAEETAAGGLAQSNDGLKEAKKEGFGAKEQVEGLTNQLENLNGTHAHASVTISVNGSVPSFGGNMNYGSLGVAAGAISGGGLGSWTEFYQEGGLLSGNTAVVGEKGYEVLAKNSAGRWMVIPHDVSQSLADLGLLGNVRQLVEGGPLPGTFIHPVTGNVLNVTGSSGGNKNKKKKTSTTISGGGTTTTTTTTTEPALETITMPLVQVTEAAVSSVAAAQVQATIEARQTRAQQAAQSAELSNLLRSIDRRLGRQERTFTTAVQSAVQQRP